MLKVENISKDFKVGFRKKTEKILDDISFYIKPKEVVSITGNSGSGKSTIARIISGTIKPDQGNIFYRGNLLISPNQSFSTEYRKDIQLIPQQPFLSLDPKQKVGDAIAETILAHGLSPSKKEAAQQVNALLEQVWLPCQLANRYPSQISGGQAQRIVIAKALALNPKLLIADESTSMLDILAQAQIIQILLNLMTKYGLSILFISHDKPLVQAFSNRIYHLSEGKLILQNKE
ncbi:ATP-binding cassette domain-containing protein [Acetobacterium paludosum]|uniref:ATP-binding cassette domain-containing protein n=1 Tax=Acetobacterium paludosum TaxID=52693 RepID=A0A923HSH5_9FIRM|nr:dipeptide/oligopeptide/nickel ABC transporter ATP-binding protein [Acetobacterium paludosum]MBC3887879.1 ATP-binding cassette domain-containing protein [Acetobacterium paludosum]